MTTLSTMVRPETLGLQRPRMPSQADELRSTMQRVRFDLLTHDWEDHLTEFLQLSVDPEWLAVVGVPDTAQNAIASQTKGLVTPGLYGHRPTLVHVDPAAQSLIGPDGYQDQAMYWPLHQWVQYMAVGLGDWFLHLGVDVEEGLLTVRNVLPWDVIVRWHPTIPGRVLELRELGIREVNGRPRWTWDQWCIDPRWDPANEGRSCRPSTGPGIGYRIWEAMADGALGEELTEAFAEASGLQGDGYWWRAPNGRPYLPIVHHTSRVTGMGWNHLEKAAAHRGTFRLAQYMTYTGRSALYASGSHVLIFGAEPGPSKAVRQDGETIQSKTVTPGMMSFIPKKSDANVTVHEVGPGINLPNLLDFSAAYADLLAVSEGHAPSDVLRKSANPTSGTALVVSDQTRRDFAASVTPVFRSRDVQACRIQAMLLNAASQDEAWPGERLQLPTEGYAITYREIPRTPQEEQQRREQLEWERSQGLISDVDLYVALHPGVSPEDAEVALVTARVTQARLQRRVSAALADEDLDDPDPDPDTPNDTEA